MMCSGRISARKPCATQELSCFCASPTASISLSPDTCTRLRSTLYALPMTAYSFTADVFQRATVSPVLSVTNGECGRTSESAQLFLLHTGRNATLRTHLWSWCPLCDVCAISMDASAQQQLESTERRHTLFSCASHAVHGVTRTLSSPPCTHSRFTLMPS